jgi:hypothetical protein
MSLDSACMRSAPITFPSSRLLIRLHLISVQRHGPFRAKPSNHASKSKAAGGILLSLTRVLSLLTRCLSHSVHAAPSCRQQRAGFTAIIIKAAAETSGSRFKFQSTDSGTRRDGKISSQVGFFIFGRWGNAGKIDAAAGCEQCG